MNLVTIDHHTVDSELLPANAVMLDVGCRGYDFTHGLLELRPAGHVYAMDPDQTMWRPKWQNVTHLAEALVYGPDEHTEYVSWHDGTGNFVAHGKPRIFYRLATDNNGQFSKVPCTNIERLMSRLKITHWDLVKLDCEASEFEILEHWPGQIATQISVEFHDYHDHDRWDAAYFERLAQYLDGRGYRFAQHNCFSQGGGTGHWDSLLVRK